MPRGLLLGDDTRVADWAFKTYKFTPTKFDIAIGIVEPPGKLVGAALFQACNGNDAQISYYGYRTFSPGIIRAIARVSVGLNLSRLTAITSKKNKRLIRALEKIGFSREGVQRRFYGHQDTDRNTGVRLVMFKERLSQLARTPPLLGGNQEK